MLQEVEAAGSPTPERLRREATATGPTLVYDVILPYRVNTGH